MGGPVRIGTLGCGRIVQKALLGVAGQVQEVRLEGIASLRPGVAQKFADEHQISKVFDSYEALLADDSIEAVYIPCTGEQHSYWTLVAARAGKHVLCEKPLATSVREAEEMVFACCSAGVILQEAFMWRLTQRAALVKNLILCGEIGELRMINVSFSFEIKKDDWRLNPEKGGGAMWDIGCYGVNAARYFTGAEPTDVSASAHWGETGVDLSMRMGLTFPGEVLANIDCSFEAPWRCRAELVGTKGRIVLENAFQSLPGQVVSLQRGMLRGGEVEEIPVEEVNQYEVQLRHFCHSIREGSLLPPAENGLANMIVLERILEDARARRRIVE